MKINGIDANTKLRHIPNMGILLDYPFIHDEMIWGEYLEEKEYFGQHFKEHISHYGNSGKERKCKAPSFLKGGRNGEY